MRSHLRSAYLLGRLVLCAVLAAPAMGTALAQDYPAKPINFVVPYPPGGASDVVARMIGEKLEKAWGQSVVIQNRPGGNGIVALSHVANSAPDGYTILMSNVGPSAINPSIYSKLPYDSLKDFVPVTLTNLVPLKMVVNANSEIKSVADLIARAKAAGGKMTYGTGGTGTAGHLAMELFMRNAGIRMEGVNYKGDGLSLQDIMSGQIDTMFTTVVSAAPHVGPGGRLRALAVTTKTRLASDPDLPTIAELGMPGFEAVSWGGVMAPANTPSAIVDKLNLEINRALKLPEIKDKLAQGGTVTVGSTPQEFGAYLLDEMKKWGDVARAANIKLE
jgi:tripartite-type tricarboxylate transporter receptor subunit TctC